MIYLVHGEDIISSKNFVLKLRESYPSVDQISLKNEKDLDNVLPPGQGLFSEKKLVIVEHFSFKKNFVIPKNLDYDVLLWFGEAVTPPSWVEKVWFFKGRDTNSSFKLADYIFYGQEKMALAALRPTIAEPQEREMLVGTLVRQARMISLFLNGEKNEVSKSPFVQSKVADQAKNWNLKKIRMALLYLLKTDLWMKQGKLSAETLLTNLTINLCRLATG